MPMGIDKSMRLELGLGGRWRFVVRQRVMEGESGRWGERLGEVDVEDEEKRGREEGRKGEKMSGKGMERGRVSRKMPKNKIKRNL